MANEKTKKDLPREIYARFTDGVSVDEVLEAYQTPDEFDEEGIVGKYRLAETGEITIEHAFKNPKPVKP